MNDEVLDANSLLKILKKYPDDVKFSTQQQLNDTKTYFLSITLQKTQFTLPSLQICFVKHKVEYPEGFIFFNAFSNLKNRFDKNNQEDLFDEILENCKTTLRELNY